MKVPKSTTKIQDIGSYIFTNKEGVLKSDLQKELLQKKWIDAVQACSDNLQKFNPDSINSIYVRGSVAMGRAIENISDIDILLITREDPTEQLHSQLSTIGNNLLKDFPFASKFDIAAYSKDDILKRKERTLIKLRAFCIYGEDLSLHIPDPRPGDDIAITLPKLENYLNKTINEIGAGIYHGSHAKMMCTWIMKCLLRSGFELVSERSNTYTRDLYYCWKQFSVYYPNRSEEMYSVLQKAIYPTDKPATLLEPLLNLGFWLKNEGEKLVLVNNNNTL